MSAAEPYSAQSVYAQIPWRPSERAVWIVWRYAELADTTELAVAMAIASFVDDLGHGWAPNIEIIGKLARRKSTAVSAAIGRLQQCGFMTVEDRTTKGEANRYTIPLVAQHMSKTPTGKRLGNKTTSNRHGPTDAEIIEGHRQARQEQHERPQQERDAKERAEAVDPAEFEQWKAEHLQRARTSGKLVD